MAEARRRDEWDRASAVLAMLYSANKGPRQPARGPDHFHPFPRRRRRRQQQPATRMDISVLKDVFIDGNTPRGV